MKEIKLNTWHDYKTVEFDLDAEGGYDHYEATVDYWFISEPDVNLKYIDEVYVNTLFKNFKEINFIKQTEISDEVRDAIINQLESEI